MFHDKTVLTLILLYFRALGIICKSANNVTSYFE